MRVDPEDVLVIKEPFGYNKPRLEEELK